MMALGIVVGLPVWLIFDTGFFTVFAVSLLLGLLHPVVKGKEYREEARQRQQRARLGEAEQEAHNRERDGLPASARQGDRGRYPAPVHPREPSPHELRAMPYKEYLRTGIATV